MPKLIRSKSVFYVFLVAAILWMAFIYMKSAEPYQQQSLKPYLESKFSTEKLREHIPKVKFTYDHQVISWQDPINMIEFFIRKAGHVSEYAVLALLWSIALLAKPVRMNIALLSSFLISLLYAMTDEWHQSFVKDRTGHGIDVVVDGVGILCALILIVLVVAIRNRVKSRRTS